MRLPPDHLWPVGAVMPDRAAGPRRSLPVCNAEHQRPKTSRYAARMATENPSGVPMTESQEWTQIGQALLTLRAAIQQLGDRGEPLDRLRHRPDPGGRVARSDGEMYARMRHHRASATPYFAAWKR